MFSVIYSFKIKEGQEAVFLEAWKELTLLIKTYEGGLGSRLHRKSELEFIAYAQWPDKLTWENSGQKLPKSADDLRSTMRASCEEINTLFELEIIEDLLDEISFH